MRPDKRLIETISSLGDQPFGAPTPDRLFPSPSRSELPVRGVFEVRSGEIQRFSDYVDLADFERQSGIKR